MVSRAPLRLSTGLEHNSYNTKYIIKQQQQQQQQQQYSGLMLLFDRQDFNPDKASDL